MKIFILAITVFLANFNLAAKTELTHKIRSVKETDPELGRGFLLTVGASANWAMGKGDYHLKVVDNYNYTIIDKKYDLKTAMGYRFGIGLGVQGKRFGFEIPVTLNVDRFKVPKISTSDKIKITSFEIGENNYFKFFKEKHYVVLGPYFQLSWKGFEERGDMFNTFGLNLGYGYNITKRLNVSLRYKFNFNSTIDNSYSLYIIKREGEDLKGDKISQRYSRYNALQVTVRFDLINTRRAKDYQAPQTSTSTSAPTPMPKIAADYSRNTDLELAQMQKDAIGRGDVDAIAGIQKEVDLRKSKSPYGKYDDTQMKDLLKKAVEKEDFIEAEKIQNELKNREALKAILGTTGKTNEAPGKSLEELQKELKEALAKEDYEAAKKIQDEINKKK